MSWTIRTNSEDCCYHENNIGSIHRGYCDLLAGHRCDQEECPMIDKVLKSFLLSHESDIALGMNDFGELQGTFEDVIGREAKE